jgi:hypothetical protein
MNLMRAKKRQLGERFRHWCNMPVPNRRPTKSAAKASAKATAELTAMQT